MNTEQARQYFLPLTYNDITKQDIIDLRYILEKHLLKRNEIEYKNFEETGVRDYVYSLCPFKKNQEVYTDGHVQYCFIEVLCDNYSRREAISFNRDGFIGFAGWASAYNTDLFVNAFIEWVDYIKLTKALKAKNKMMSYVELYEQFYTYKNKCANLEIRLNNITNKMLEQKQENNRFVDTSIKYDITKI